MAHLRLLVLDIEAFAWHCEGRRGSFVRLLRYDNDDLIFDLTPLGTVARWPDGEAVGWMMRSLLGRLRRTNLF